MGNRVVIVGGGLAGLAAAAALGERGFAVTLLESRPRFGGRASSFVDQTTGEAIDNCQHVALGCCTNFRHFCRTVGIEKLFVREPRLTFVGPDGRMSRFSSAPLPAPLHLIPALLGLNFLSAGEKWRLALGLRDLARVEPAIASNETFLEWLRRHRQPEVVIERFWHVVLVSALSETLDRIDVGHARKVFVDSFLRNRAGWEVWLPTAPLDRLYGETLQRWFAAHSVAARLSAGVARVEVEASAQYSVRSTQHSGDSIPISGNPQGSTEAPGLRSQESGVRRQESVAHQVVLRSGESVDADHVILAVPQNLVLSLLPGEWAAHPDLAGISRLETAPISSVHLWFDRPITDLRHATFVGRLSQWLFNRTAIAGAEVRELGTPLSSGSTEEAATARSRGDFYYQIVISASREVVGRPQEETIAKVIAELAEVWPVAREARLVHARLVTEHKAVVSMLPGIDRLRPRQQSPIANLQLAGDWTQTGWPGTMEGAVRSGYLAAENVLAQCGRSESIVQPDLATAVLSKILFGL